MIDFVCFGQDNVMMLKDYSVCVNSSNGLSIAILSSERHVQLKLLAVSNVSIASFTPSKSINSSVKRFTCLDIY